MFTQLKADKIHLTTVEELKMLPGQKMECISLIGEMIM